MYCPDCGAESTQGLNYCKRCGANLTAQASEAVPSKVSLKLVLPFLAAMGLVTLTGLAIPMIAIEELTNKGYPPSSWTGVLIVSFLITFGLDVLLIWLLLHLIRISQPSGSARSRTLAAIQRPAAEIAAPPIIVASVTEHTTRSFEHAAREGESSRE